MTELYPPSYGETTNETKASQPKTVGERYPTFRSHFMQNEEFYGKPVMARSS